jgi:hypothetical protein
MIHVASSYESVTVVTVMTVVGKPENIFFVTVMVLRKKSVMWIL